MWNPLDGQGALSVAQAPWRTVDRGRGGRGGRAGAHRYGRSTGRTPAQRQLPPLRRLQHRAGQRRRDLVGHRRDGRGEHRRSGSARLHGAHARQRRRTARPLAGDRHADRQRASGGGLMAGWMTSTVVGAHLDALAAAHANFCTRSGPADWAPGQAGATSGYVKIAATTAGSPTSRWGVLLTGGVHARELAPPDALVSFLEKLATAYLASSAITYPSWTDPVNSIAYDSFTIPWPWVRKVVESLDLYVAPLVNPDGRDFALAPVSAAEQELHKEWRKNRRPAPGGNPNPLAVGVDVNRNFDVVWDFNRCFAVAHADVHSSTDPADETYIGPSAESEPETKNVAGLLRSKEISFYIDFHAFSRDILYSWGLDTNQSTDATQTFTNAAWDHRSDGETHERSHLHPERRLGSPRAGALALHGHAIGQPLRDLRGRRRLLLLAVVHGGDRQIADPPGDGLHDRGRRRSQRRPRPRRGGLHPQLRHAIPEARARDPSRRVGLPDGGRVVERRGALGARAPGEPLTMSDDGTLQQLAGAVTEALQPLQTRLAPGDARGLIAEMGLSLPPALDGLPAFTTATAEAITKVEALGAPAATLATAVQHEDVGAIIEATTTLISAITEAIAALDAVATALSSVAGSVGVANPSDITTFAASFGEKLLEHVVIDYLAGYRPVLLRVLALLGIVDLELVPPDGGDPTKVAHQRHDLTLGNLGQIFSDPGAYLVSQFGWNSPALNSTALLGRLRDLLVELGAKASIDPSTGALDLALLRIAPTSAISPPGLSAILAESLSDGLTLPLPSVLPEGWTAQLVVGGTLAAGVELRILPPGQLEVHAKANVDGQLQFAATRTPPAGQRVTILGLPGIATLDAASIGLTSGASFHWDSGSGAARGAFVVGFAVNGGKLHVGSSNADGFVASLLGGLDL